jgi:tyrosyl-tRNA synthetase
MDPISIIKKDMLEVIGLDEIKLKMEEKDILTAYWGVSPIRNLNIGVLIPLLKIKDLLSIPLDVKIFIADLHAIMDQGSSILVRIPARIIYYKFMLTVLLDLIGVSTHSQYFEFVRGSDLQLDRKYVLDLFSMSSIVSTNQAKKVGSEILKHDKDPKLSHLLYPLMQILDETIIHADIQIGDANHRKIFNMSRDYIELFGYDKCSYIINPSVPSLCKNKEKLNKEDPFAVIEFHDDAKTIDTKIKNAYCIEGNTDPEANPCIAIIKYILFPIYGYFLTYDRYTDFETDWRLKKITTLQLKKTLALSLDLLIQPIRDAFYKNVNLYSEAFDTLK